VHYAEKRTILIIVQTGVNMQTRVERPTSVSNPQRRGIENRRKELAKWHRSKEWIAFRDEHARKPESVCIHCEMKNLQARRRLDGELKLYKSGTRKGQVVRATLTVNHLSRRKYITLKEYTTWDEDCEVCCDLCNKLYEQGKVICPICKVRYIDSNSNDKECDNCYYQKHPEELREKLENIEARNERNRVLKKQQATKRRIAKVKHPCRFHGYGQKCRQKEGTCICIYSPSKAESRCEWFEKKKVIK
jgi:hypothetical protein